MSTDNSATFPNIQAGRYEMLEVVGTGAAGVVYKAFDTTLKKNVAIKKLHESASEKQAMRFQREAKVAGTLSHPNVTRILDFGLTEKNEPYLVANFIDGESLQDRLKREGPMPVVTALKLFIQIAGGLDHAHKHNIIHRDIKPSNIMLPFKKTEDGTASSGADDSPSDAQIVDFGLAKDEHDQDLTKSGTGIGTPLFMSPEQFHGLAVDKRSDIYSFGCLMFNVLTGTPPFRGQTALETMEMHMVKEPPLMESVMSSRKGAKKPKPGAPSSSNHDISENLEALVRKCINKEPEDRFATVEDLRVELLAELQKVLMRQAQKKTTVDEVSTAPPAVKRDSWIKNPLTWVCIIILFTGMIGMKSVTDLQKLDKQREPRPLHVPPAYSQKEEPKIEHRMFYDAGDDKDILIGYSDEELKKYLQGKPRAHVDVSNSDLTPAGLKYFAGTKVNDLVLRMNPLAQGELTVLATVKNLKRLEIGLSPTMNYTSIKELSANPNLRQLDIFDQKVDQTLFDSIAQVKQLEYLSLDRCKGIKSAKLTAPLATMPKLKILHLVGSDITDDALEPLLSLPLELLNVRNDHKITDKSMRKIASMTTLKSLNITDTVITDACIRSVMQKNPHFNPTCPTIKAVMRRERIRQRTIHQTNEDH